MDDRGEGMSYLYVLERIEDGRINVKQAIKEIERESKRCASYKAKKIKIHIVDEGKAIRLPAIGFGMIKGVLKVCPPFVKFITKHASDNPKVSQDVNEIIDTLTIVLDLLKDYPPIDFVRVNSKNDKISISTK